jgi:prevent-host-death family protein
MKYVADTEAQKELANILNAAQREPVVIQQQQHDIAVILSIDDYEKLRDSSVEDFQHFCDEVGQKATARGMTEKKLKEILSEDE